MRRVVIISDGRREKQIDYRQLLIGQRLEREHTSSPVKARKIALDHLWEFPDYYTRLVRMESTAKRHWLRANPRKQRGALMTLETATAARLCALPTAKIIEENLFSIFGMSEQRFQELWDGDDFSNDVEEMTFNLSKQFQADMDTAVMERDVPEVAQILKLLRKYWKRYYDHNEVVYFPEEVSGGNALGHLNEGMNV